MIKWLWTHHRMRVKTDAGLHLVALSHPGQCASPSDVHSLSIRDLASIPQPPSPSPPTPPRPSPSRPNHTPPSPYRIIQFVPSDFQLNLPQGIKFSAQVWRGVRVLFPVISLQSPYLLFNHVFMRLQGNELICKPHLKSSLINMFSNAIDSL